MFPSMCSQTTGNNDPFRAQAISATTAVCFCKKKGHKFFHIFIAFAYKQETLQHIPLIKIILLTLPREGVIIITLISITWGGLVPLF